MPAEADTEAGDRLDVLVTLVEAYERTHFQWTFRTRSKPSNSG